MPDEPVLTLPSFVMGQDTVTEALAVHGGTCSPLCSRSWFTHSSLWAPVSPVKLWTKYKLPRAQQWLVKCQALFR